MLSHPDHDKAKLAGEMPVTALLVSPATARAMLECGQTRLYQLLAAGELDSFLDGRSRKILVASIHAYVRRKLEASRKAT
jgi:hypothetical protein